jgi:hypothetical protein
MVDRHPAVLLLTVVALAVGCKKSESSSGSEGSADSTAARQAKIDDAVSKLAPGATETLYCIPNGMRVDRFYRDGRMSKPSGYTRCVSGLLSSGAVKPGGDAYTYLPGVPGILGMSTITGQEYLSDANLAFPCFKPSSAHVLFVPKPGQPGEVRQEQVDADITFEGIGLVPSSCAESDYAVVDNTGKNTPGTHSGQQYVVKAKITLSLEGDSVQAATNIVLPRSGSHGAVWKSPR